MDIFGPGFEHNMKFLKTFNMLEKVMDDLKKVENPHHFLTTTTIIVIHSELLIVKPSKGKAFKQSNSKFYNKRREVP